MCVACKMRQIVAERLTWAADNWLSRMLTISLNNGRLSGFSIQHEVSRSRLERIKRKRGGGSGVRVGIKRIQW